MEEQERAWIEFLKPDENVSQFFARVRTEPVLCGVPFIDHISPLKPNTLLEICGLADTGKTETLYHVRTSC